jgi:hypothetical protein
LKYYEESDNAKDVKEVFLRLGEVEVGRMRKQEGSFWSTRELDVGVLLVKGNNRDVCLQMD